MANHEKEKAVWLFVQLTLEQLRKNQDIKRPPCMMLCGRAGLIAKPTAAPFQLAG